MFYVTTHDHQRHAHWERVFGATRLPVKVGLPRWQVGVWQPGAILAYDLDAARLHWMQRQRFAGYVSRRTGMSMADAMYAIDGWPIEADDCEIGTAVSADTAVSVFRGVFARERLARVMVGA